MATDTPFLATERMLPYYCFKYGRDGFEFWGLSWWTYDPWKLGWHSFIRQSDDGKTPLLDPLSRRRRLPRLPRPRRRRGRPGQHHPTRTGPRRAGRFRSHDPARPSLARNAKAAGPSAAAAERALALARELVTIPNAGGLRSTEILPDPDRIPPIRRAVNAALTELMR